MAGAFEIDYQSDRGFVTAGEDLSTAGKQYLAVALNSDLEVLASALSAKDPIFGILQNAPLEGVSASVRVDGVSFCIAGAGDIAVGDALVTDGDGKLVTASTGPAHVVGICVAAAAADNIGSVDLSFKKYIPA